jgi:uncharacterized protein
MKFIFLIALLFTSTVFSQIPTLTSPVMDEANVLKNKSELEQKIRTVYNNGQGPQVNILVIPTLNGQSLEEYANQVFMAWKLGDSKRDDGVLFLIVINDRKMRIEVGQGLEGSLTDLYSKRILGSLKTYFKSGDYSGGINHGLDQIITIITKEDAVQTPEQIQSIKQAQIETQKKISDFLFSAFLILVGLAFIIFPLRIVRRNVQGFKSSKSDLEGSKEKLQKTKSKILTIESEHGHLEMVKEKIESKINETLQNQEKLEEKLSLLKKQAEKCDYTIFTSKKRNLEILNAAIDTSKDNITQYKRILNGKES